VITGGFFTPLVYQRCWNRTPVVHLAAALLALQYMSALGDFHFYSDGVASSTECADPG
jgi:hypothetical protein